MENSLKKYSGIHPGLILERELSKRNLKKGPFALSLNEYPQTFNEITKGRRGIPAPLALKIDEALGWEEGTMLFLQAYFEIEEVKRQRDIANHPNLDIIRPILFWDTDFNKIEWQKYYKSIIRRVFERGDDKEKAEILRFYGKEKIIEVTGSGEVVGNRIPLEFS